MIDKVARYSADGFGYDNIGPGQTDHAVIVIISSEFAVIKLMF
jgi:hypothetical protein